MKNDYIIDGNIVRIFVNSKKYGRQIVLISLEDLPKLEGMRVYV